MKPGCRQVVDIQVRDAVRHPTEGYGVIVWCPGGVEDLIERLEANLAILVPGLGVEDRKRRTPASNRGNRQAAARVIPAAGGLDELDAGKMRIGGGARQFADDLARRRVGNVQIRRQEAA